VCAHFLSTQTCKTYLQTGNERDWTM